MPDSRVRANGTVATGTKLVSATKAGSVAPSELFLLASLCLTAIAATVANIASAISAGLHRSKVDG